VGRHIGVTQDPFAEDLPTSASAVLPARIESAAAAGSTIVILAFWRRTRKKIKAREGEGVSPPRSLSPVRRAYSVCAPLTSAVSGCARFINSVGMMNLVASPSPSALSVSRYCSVSVLLSTPCATL